MVPLFASGRRLAKPAAEMIHCSSMKILMPLALTLLISPLADAAEADSDRILRIGIKETPPFTIRNDDGSWAGPTVWLVERIAQSLGYETHYKEVELAEIFDQLQSGDLDIGAAALSITSKREEIIDFTHSYFEGGSGSRRAPTNGKCGFSP